MLVSLSAILTYEKQAFGKMIFLSAITKLCLSQTSCSEKDIEKIDSKTILFLERVAFVLCS